MRGARLGRVEKKLYTGLLATMRTLTTGRADEKQNCVARHSLGLITSPCMKPDTRGALAAYALPFAVFTGLIAVQELVGTIGKGSDSWWLAHPQYWIFPLQTVICAVLLAFYRQDYSDWRRPLWWVGVPIGIIALAIWLAPHEVFGTPARTEGFDPFFFGAEGPGTAFTIFMRFTRLVIIVPLVEEIFWRGFLLRYLIREDFQSIPFGEWNVKSFFGVATLFMLVHGMADWPTAFIFSVIVNFVAVRTRSLAACVVTHAVTNAGLGAYVMATRQWGYW